jgi:hypothetical protein
MSPPAEQDLTLPSPCYQPSHPQTRGGVGNRAARQHNPLAIPSPPGKSAAADHPSPHLPVSPSHRDDGARHRLVGEPLTPLSALPTLAWKKLSLMLTFFRFSLFWMVFGCFHYIETPKLTVSILKRNNRNNQLVLDSSETSFVFIRMN